MLQSQLWLKNKTNQQTNKTFCGVNTNSIMLELLEEFYNLMEKDGRKGMLVFLFQRESQHFETYA